MKRLFKISIIDKSDKSEVHAPEYLISARNPKHAIAIFKKAWNWHTTSWLVKASLIRPT